MLKLSKDLGMLLVVECLSENDFIVRFVNGEEKTGLLVDKATLDSLELGVNYKCLMLESDKGNLLCKRVTRGYAAKFKLEFGDSLEAPDLEEMSVSFESDNGNVMNKCFELKFVEMEKEH